MRKDHSYCYCFDLCQLSSSDASVIVTRSARIGETSTSKT